MIAATSRRAVLLLAGLAWVGAAGLAQAAPRAMTVPLTGAQQVPPVQTPGSGSAALTYDPTTRVLTWTITFSGLTGEPTMAHVHGPAAEGKNGPVLIWLSTKGEPVTSPIKGEATLSTDQAQELMAGDTYINVHTKDHPAGEIRGQIMPPKS